MAVTQGGQSALVRCCKSNRRELAVLLVESGADINSTDEVSFRNNLLYRACRLRMLRSQLQTSALEYARRHGEDFVSLLQVNRSRLHSLWLSTCVAGNK
jgi:hypothetical protein